MPPDPVSLVDFLKSEGVASDLAARRGLWGMFDPATVYRGTATQNLTLLDFLRIAAETPRLELTKQSHNANEPIRARVFSKSRVGIESSLNQLSFEAEAGTIVDLGPATSTYGFTPLRVVSVATPSLATHGLVVLRPDNGKVLVELLTASTNDAGATIPVTLTPQEVNLFTSFLQQATANNGALLAQAFPLAAAEFAGADQWAGLLLDAKLGIALIVLEVATPVGFLVGLGSAYAWTFGKIWLTRTVALTTLSNSDKSTLTGIIEGIDLLKMVWDLPRNLRNKKKLCDNLEALTSLPGWGIDQLNFDDPDSQLKLAGKMFTDFVSKSVVGVCRMTRRQP